MIFLAADGDVDLRSGLLRLCGLRFLRLCRERRFRSLCRSLLRDILRLLCRRRLRDAGLQRRQIVRPGLGRFSLLLFIAGGIAGGVAGLIAFRHAREQSVTGLLNALTVALRRTGVKALLIVLLRLAGGLGGAVGIAGLIALLIGLLPQLQQIRLRVALAAASAKQKQQRCRKPEKRGTSLHIKDHPSAEHSENDPGPQAQ